MANGKLLRQLVRSGADGDVEASAASPKRPQTFVSDAEFGDRYPRGTRAQRPI